MKMAIQNKYSLIRYYYTEMILLSGGGGSFFKPLYFVNGFDDVTANPGINNASLSNNFMLGDALKVGVLADDVGKDTSQFYFPAGTWCSMKINDNYGCATYETGTNIEKPSKAYDY